MESSHLLSTFLFIFGTLALASAQPSSADPNNSTNSDFAWPLETEYAAPPLQFDFYRETCPQLEQIVEETVALYSKKFLTTPAQLLRLFFHDSFVQGADASVLIQSTNSTKSERSADNNFSLGSFFVVDDIKQQLEAVCPNTVSCADILAVAAVYAIAQAGGPLYPIELGRRDSLTSYAQSAQTYLPGATLNVSGLLQNFQLVGLDIVDLVCLSGAHTIGQGHCSSIKDRIYPKVDPDYKPGFGEQLLSFCTNLGQLKAPNFQPNVQFFMDPITPLTFDNQYFKNLETQLALFSSDKVLFHDLRTVELVKLYASNQYAFFEQFGQSLRKMGKLNVLTGTQGQIRKKCWVQNSGNADPALDREAFM